jgi:hypothetical protein
MIYKKKKVNRKFAVNGKGTNTVIRYGKNLLTKQEAEYDAATMKRHQSDGEVWVKNYQDLKQKKEEE